MNNQNTTWNNDPTTDHTPNTNNITPDHIWKDDPQITFIYNNDHTLHTTQGTTTHTQLILNNPQYYKTTNRTQAINLRTKTLPNTALIGRIGNYNGQHTISFWNTNPKTYKNLKPCLQALQQYLTPHTKIQTPINPQNQNETTQQQDTKTQQQLHLMHPNDKKQTMKKLGLNPNSTKNPWQQQLENNKITTPGTKWWAINSETFTQKLNKILENK